MLRKKCINERVFLDFGKSVCVVLFNTCHLFPQTAIDLCGFWLLTGGAHLFLDVCRFLHMWKCFRMDMPGVMDSFSDCGN